MTNPLKIEKSEEGQNTAPAVSRDRYGINAHIPDERTLNLIKDAGIQWIRLDFNWADIEPSKDGRLQYDQIQKAVNLALQRGLSIFATLSQTPSWAGNGQIGSPPSDPSRWSRFVSATVSLFKGQISHWGMWNEPNGVEDGFWTGSPEQYRDMILIEGSKAARKANPDCKVVGPEVICFGNWPNWLKRVLNDEAIASINVFSCHIYKDKSAEAAVEMFEQGERNVEESNKLGWKPGTAIQTVLKGAGIPADMPIWLSEIGWHAKPSPRDEAVSEDEQAKRVLKICQSMNENARHQWWLKTFFYEIKDDPKWNHDHPEKSKSQGLLDANYRPRKSYDTYSKYLHSLPS